MQKYFNDDMHDLINVISLLGLLIVFIPCLIIASFVSVHMWLEQLIQSVELAYYLTSFNALAFIAVAPVWHQKRYPARKMSLQQS